MELNITLSADSLASLKATLTPNEAPLFGPEVHTEMLALAIIDNHGSNLVNGIVDQRGEDLINDIVEQIDLSSLAYEIDVRALAREMDIDHNELAEHLSMSEVADAVIDNLDLDDLSERMADKVDLSQFINHKQLALQLVSQFINNQEFRDTCVAALVERLTKSVEA
jgi:hypothetical protein